jgi:hypothetical protein
MKFIKKYKSFLEDGNASVNTSTGGMGSVVSAQPGALPGQTGTTGSVDVSFTFKKEKRKKGGPSQVSDLRDLKDVKTDKVEDIKESYKLTDDESLLIEDCIIELIDMGFEINKVNVDSEDQEYDIDDDTQGNFKSQEIKISLFKQVKKYWRGNLLLGYSFDKNEVYKKNTSTLRPKKELEDYESKIVDVAEEASYLLINHLEYTSGDLIVEFLVAGSAMPNFIDHGDIRPININVHIILRRNFYPVDEAYNNEQEYINEIIDKFKGYNIRPLVLNQILDFYNDQIIDNYNSGKQPNEFVDMIVKDMELGSGGYMSQRVGSKGWNNKVIKYL